MSRVIHTPEPKVVHTVESKVVYTATSRVIHTPESRAAHTALFRVVHTTESRLVHMADHKWFERWRSKVFDERISYAGGFSSKPHMFWLTLSVSLNHLIRLKA